jgi:hypothetical protein
MPKKRSLLYADSYLKGKTAEAETALQNAQRVWSRYLKKVDPLRIELDDLCRRFKVFSKSAAKLFEE